MSSKVRLFGSVVLLALASIPTTAGPTVTGIFPERSTGSGIADVIESNWNVTEFDCRRSSFKSTAALFSTQLPVGRSIISLPRSVISPTVGSAPDLFAALGGTDIVNLVGKYDTTNDSLITWNGSVCTAQEVDCAETCFCVDTPAGQGFLVDLKSSTRFDVSGSDGALRIELNAPASELSLSGTHQISLPFSTPLTLASELFSSINAQAGTQAALNVQSLRASDDSLVIYSGTDGLNDFALTPGFGYRAQVSSSLLYTPPFADSGAGSTLYVTASSGPCVGRQLSLTFTVEGGETESPIPFVFSVACAPNAALTAAMGINDGPVLDVTNGTVDFGVFSTLGRETTIGTTRTGHIVPALGRWGMIVFAIVLLAAGAFLILGRFG